MNRQPQPDDAAKLERHTKRRGLDGTFHLRCQDVTDGKQCELAVYIKDRCWPHYMPPGDTND